MAMVTPPEANTRNLMVRGFFGGSTDCRRDDSFGLRIFLNSRASRRLSPGYRVAAMPSGRAQFAPVVCFIAAVGQGAEPSITFARGDGLALDLVSAGVIYAQ